jgi:hypothetical protein
LGAGAARTIVPAARVVLNRFLGRPVTVLRYERRSVRRHRITLDLDTIERALFEADGPAYRLMEAMVSVKEREGWEGY